MYTVEEYYVHIHVYSTHAFKRARLYILLVCIVLHKDAPENTLHANVMYLYQQVHAAHSASVLCISDFNISRPQGEGNIFTVVCLATMGLMATRSPLGLVTARSVRMLSCPRFIVSYHEEYTFSRLYLTELLHCFHGLCGFKNCLRETISR